MAQPEIAADHAKLQERNEKYREIEQKIQSLYDEWENLSEVSQ